MFVVDSAVVWAQSAVSSDVATLTAAYSEWVTGAEFSATYTLRRAITTQVGREEKDLSSLSWRPEATGSWCKRGQYWRMSVKYDRPAIRMAVATPTTPGSLRNVSWERLCSDDYVVNYFPEDSLNQAGLSSRILPDGLRSGQFHPACVTERSILNPLGSDIYNLDTGEWRLPGQPKDCTWTPSSLEQSQIRFAAEFQLDGVRSEIQYTFRTSSHVPVIESIRCSHTATDGTLMSYQDFYLSSYQASPSGLELPSRMESRLFPFTYTNSDGDKVQAAIVDIWDVDLNMATADSDFSLDFSEDTTFSGFAIPPQEIENWTLVGFDNQSVRSVKTPPPVRRGYSRWLLFGNIGILLLVMLAWAWKRKSRR